MIDLKTGEVTAGTLAVELEPPDDDGPAIASVEQIGELAEDYGVDGILRALAEHCKERSRYWCLEYGRSRKDHPYFKALEYMHWLEVLLGVLKADENWRAKRA